MESTALAHSVNFKRVYSSLFSVNLTTCSWPHNINWLREMIPFLNSHLLFVKVKNKSLKLSVERRVIANPLLAVLLVIQNRKV